MISEKLTGLMNAVRSKYALDDKLSDSKVIPLSSTDWKIITFNFIAQSDIVLYGVGKKGDWMELKNWYFSELGGIVKTLLSALERNFNPVIGGVA